MNYLKNIKKGIRIKDTFNYFIIVVMLVVPLLISSFGNLPRSSSGLLAQMAYSILLAVSLNLVVGFSANCHSVTQASCALAHTSDAILPKSFTM